MSFGQGSSGPSNSSDGGFYQPDTLSYPALENYQQFLNTTNGTLTPQVLDSIHNLITELPNLYSTQTQLGAEDVIWLQRLTSGTPCINLDPNGDQCVDSHCPICFGTGFTSGYTPAISLKMSFNPQNVETSITQAGLIVKETPTAWTIDTEPIMKESDVIVTYANERYVITSQESQEKQGRRVYQKITLSRRDKYDVVYDIPVPSVYGDAHKDFKASIKIRGPYTDFMAAMLINNFYWPTNPAIPDS